MKLPSSSYAKRAVSTRESEEPTRGKTDRKSTVEANQSLISILDSSPAARASNIDAAISVEAIAACA